MCLCLSVFCASFSARAEVTEDKIKAVFLYNFLNYVTWPEGANGKNTKTICLFMLGDEILKILHSVQKRDGSFAVEKRSDGQLENCNIAYEDIKFSDSDQRFSVAKKNHILRVSSATDFIKNNKGNVEFYSYKRGVKIRIDSRRLQEIGLKASSKLLSISSIVNR